MAVSQHERLGKQLSDYRHHEAFVPPSGFILVPEINVTHLSLVIISLGTHTIMHWGGKITHRLDCKYHSTEREGFVPFLWKIMKKRSHSHWHLHPSVLVSRGPLQLLITGHLIHKKRREDGSARLRSHVSKAFLSTFHFSSNSVVPVQ